MPIAGNWSGSFALSAPTIANFASLNVATGECLNVHHFAVLIGVGATTVNAYVAGGDYRTP